MTDKKINLIVRLIRLVVTYILYKFCDAETALVYYMISTEFRLREWLDG